MTRETPVQGSAATTRRSGWRKILRHKGHIGQWGLLLLTGLACLPLVMVVMRILAFPGAGNPPFAGFAVLRDIGAALNQWLSLDWVPPGDRPAILYLLLLPTGALFIAVARLTFGLRVLGLRSILLAIGFQEAGLLPSLALMAIVVGAIIAIRPGMQRIRLPLFARISVILCFAAILMLGALMLGPWVRSEAIWRVAFFPVIIIAMLAEGIAKTLVSDSAILAAWRAAWTIVVALIIAVVGQLTFLQDVLLQFPELLITQLVLIIFIAEFFDLRLFEGTPKKIQTMLEPGDPKEPRGKIAVVRNRWNTDVIGRLGRPAAAKYRRRSVQRIVDVLREGGFSVRVYEGGTALLRNLQKFMPPEPGSDAPAGLVLNLGTGVQGAGRFAHVPAMLESGGVAYTGPDPVTQVHLLDRYVLMSFLRNAGVPVPRVIVMRAPDTDTGELRYPLAVRPRYEPDLGRTLVKDRPALAKTVQKITEVYAQDAVVEEYQKGREFRVALFGNDHVECLPILENASRGRRRTCPAKINEALADQVRHIARDAYAAAGCRDYARIDLTVPDSGGSPQVIAVNWADLFARRGSVAVAAEAAGYSYAELILRVVDAALRRYGMIGPAAKTSRSRVDDSVVNLADRRVATK